MTRYVTGKVIPVSQGEQGLNWNFKGDEMSYLAGLSPVQDQLHLLELATNTFEFLNKSYNFSEYSLLLG
jgi:hypothetical protein